MAEEINTPVDLLDARATSPETLAYMWMAIEHGTNIAIVGEGSGLRDSYPNALSFLYPEGKTPTTMTLRKGEEIPSKMAVKEEGRPKRRQAAVTRCVQPGSGKA